jgi:hypothetical protein
MWLTHLSVGNRKEVETPISTIKITTAVAITVIKEYINVTKVDTPNVK